MKKIIWVDVGTHFAQEHTSIFGSNYSFYSFVLRRFLGGKILKRGKFVSFKELRDIINSRIRIRKRSREFYTVFVEANPKIAYKKYFYPATDMFFNLALTGDSHTPVSITKLFFGDGGQLAEGVSLFSEKHNSHDDSHIVTFGVSASYFFSELRSFLNEKFGDYDVLLRLNCEGVEDDIIYSAYSSFGNKLKLICGSLKDVEELKGLEASQKLDKFINNNHLLFVDFSKRIFSWPKAHAAVLNMLEKKDQRL